jgi:hypothetical protein
MRLRDMKWSFLLNRYIFTFGSIAIMAAAWNLFVVLNDDGIVAGRVVGPDNRPVEGATVTLYQKTLYVAEPRAKMTTDATGEFLFTGHKYYRIWLESNKEGVGQSPKKEYRLYFKGQNMTLAEPLRLRVTQ